MPPNKRSIPKSLSVAYVSVFAALNALADLVPFTPIMGIPGASFRLAWVLSPLTGILLGPNLGAISCLIAGLSGIFLGQPPIFGAFTPFVGPLRPAISAFVAGMLASKRWGIPASVLSVLIVLWLLLPTGRAAFVILIFHMAGLAMTVLLRGRIGDFVSSEKTRNAYWALFSAAYCGNVSRHLFGNILLVIILDLQPIYFVWALPYTLIEQVTFATGTTIIGISLNRLRIREYLRLS